MGSKGVTKFIVDKKVVTRNLTANLVSYLFVAHLQVIWADSSISTLLSTLCSYEGGNGRIHRDENRQLSRCIYNEVAILLVP
jgi:hypothetical protein